MSEPNGSEKVEIPSELPFSEKLKIYRDPAVRKGTKSAVRGINRRENPQMFKAIREAGFVGAATAIEEKKRAGIDSLTGLHTREAFDLRFKEEIERLGRTPGAKTTLVIFDSDKLKKINDTLGHAEGDKYLQKIANVFKSSIRRDLDFVARWGGDEFGMILPGTSIEGARTFFYDVLNPQFEANGVSISAGAVEIDPHEDAQKTFERADATMYAAKHDVNKKPGQNSFWTLHENITA